MLGCKCLLSHQSGLLPPRWASQGEKKPQTGGAGGPDPCLKEAVSGAIVLRAKAAQGTSISHEEHWELLLNVLGTQSVHGQGFCDLQVPVPCHQKSRAGDQEALPWSAPRCRGLGWRLGSPYSSGQVGLTGNTAHTKLPQSCRQRGSCFREPAVPLGLDRLANGFAVPGGC